ncbi:MAG: hypothetical protein ACI9NI_001110 [Olleya marilimosa]
MTVTVALKEIVLIVHVIRVHVITATVKHDLKTGINNANFGNFILRLAFF